MPEAFRLVRRSWSAQAFDGSGAQRHGGRWNPPGVAVVYVSATRSLALLELLVHLRRTERLHDYVIFGVRFAAPLVERLAARALPAGWRGGRAPAALRAVGAGWTSERRTAVLEVPSAVVPEESNFLLNPEHREFGRIEVGAAEPFELDPRLLGG